MYGGFSYGSKGYGGITSAGHQLSGDLHVDALAGAYFDKALTIPLAVAFAAIAGDVLTGHTPPRYYNTLVFGALTGIAVDVTRGAFGFRHKIPINSITRSKAISIVRIEE